MSYPTATGWEQHGKGFLVEQLYKRAGWRVALGLSEAERRLEQSVLVEQIKENSKESLAEMLVFLDYGK